MSKNREACAPMRIAGLVALVAAAAMLLPANAGAETGQLAHEGCITGETGTGPAGSGACAAIASATGGTVGDNSGIASTRFITLSPDGESLYAAAVNDDAVARFTRDPVTGALTYEGCITGETQSGPAGTGACAAIGSATAGGVNSGLDGVFTLAVSPDGKWLYAMAVSDDSLARFSRDPATGELTYEDCTTGETESGPAGTGACTTIGSATAGGADSGLDVLRGLAVSPDGLSLYAGSRDDDGVARFSRDPATGGLTYENCITGEKESGPSGTGACAAIGSAATGGVNSGLDGPEFISVSPDGESIYTVSQNDDALGHFSRDPATGGLTYKDCITGEKESGPVAGGGSGACAAIGSVAAGGADSGLDAPQSAVLSPDGGSLYAVAAVDDAVVRFSRDPANGQLGYEDCITGETESGPTGTGACAAIGSATIGGLGSGLNNPRGALGVSPDGESVYVGSGEDDAVASFDRTPGIGQLAYEGCITGRFQSGPVAGGGTGACTGLGITTFNGVDSGLDGLSGGAISPDGASLYVSSSNDSAVTHFSRELPPEPALSVSDVSVPEGDAGQTQATFEVMLSNGTPDTVRVEARTENGSAIAPTDYESRTATLAFPPGIVTETFSVAVNGDTDFEPDETFLARLGGAQGATIADDGVGTIQDDDPAPPETDPPETTIDAGPTGTTNDETPVFEFSADETATFECRLDSALERDFAPCASPAALGLVADGPHVFEVRATDSAANLDLTPAIGRFAVATTGCRGQTATIVGTAGPDRITGTPGDDVIVSFAGDDRVNGAGGNDRICAGGDDDILFGGTGADQMVAGSGDDVATGDDGADFVFGGGGEDTVNGLAGEDEVRGGAGDDTSTGGLDADTLRGGSDDDTLNGADGLDTLLGGSGEDALSGDAGDDTLRGNSADDLLGGGTGADELFGNSGDDVARGSAGADELSGGSGDDELQGENDSDQLRGGGDDDDLDGGAGIDSCAGGSGENALGLCE